MTDPHPDPALHNPHCFGCGPENPVGVGFRAVHAEPGLLRGTIVPFLQVHEGGVRRVHGGVLASALDEVLGQLCHQEFGTDCMTAQLNVRFVRPGATGDACEAVGRVVRREGRKMWVEGEILRDGEVLCSAEGLWLQPRQG